MKSPKINSFSRYSSDSAKSHSNLSRHGKLQASRISVKTTDWQSTESTERDERAMI